MHDRRQGSALERERAVVAAVALTGAAALADWITGAELNFSLFYLPGVALAAWYGGRRWSLALAVLAGVTWLAVERSSEQVYAHDFVVYWNASVRLAVFAVVGVLTAEVRRFRDREAARALDEAAAVAPATFFQMVEAELNHLARHDRPLTLAYVDVRSAGADEPSRADALAAWSELAARTLREVLRASDVVARPRGRELAILFPGTGPEAAAAALARVREVLGDLAVPGGRTPPPLSIGAVTCLAAPATLSAVVQRAYQLMYDAHRLGEPCALLTEVLGTPSTPASPPEPAARTV